MLNVCIFGPFSFPGEAYVIRKYQLEVLEQI